MICAFDLTFLYWAVKHRWPFTRGAYYVLKTIILRKPFVGNGHWKTNNTLGSGTQHASDMKKDKEIAPANLLIN